MSKQKSHANVSKEYAEMMELKKSALNAMRVMVSIHLALQGGLDFHGWGEKYRKDVIADLEDGIGMLKKALDR